MMTRRRRSYRSCRCCAPSTAPSAAPTDLLNVRDGSVDKLFITADATITPVDLVTEFGKAPAESRIIKTVPDVITINLDPGTGTPLQSKGFDIPTKGTGTDYHSATAGVLSGAPAPILPVSGKIDLAHVTGDHFTTSKANLASGGALETHKTAQDAFNEFDFVLGGTEDQIIFLPTAA